MLKEETVKGRQCQRKKTLKEEMLKEKNLKGKNC